MSTPKRTRLQREPLELAVWVKGPPELERPGPDGDDVYDGRRDARDTGVGNAYGRDDSGLPELGPLEPFASWQSVAATIMRQIERSAGFDPSSTAFDAVGWANYSYQFETLPLLQYVVHEGRHASISSLSLAPVISTVTGMIGDLVPPDTLAGIINSIKKIAELAVMNKGAQQKDNHAQQGVLTVKDGDLRLGLLRTTVQMKYEKGKGYEQLNQQINVECRYGPLDYDRCIQEAGTLLAWDRTDVDEWLDRASSWDYQPNTSPAWNN
ncbi:hypothetical protein ACWC5I_21570 [Kitasatospora sp. NPDC001574]